MKGEFPALLFRFISYTISNSFVSVKAALAGLGHRAARVTGREGRAPEWPRMVKA